jgi:hypothetical protein
MYAPGGRGQEYRRHGCETVYQYRDTEPQPRDAAPRWRVYTRVQRLGRRADRRDSAPFAAELIAVWGWRLASRPQPYVKCRFAKARPEPVFR